MRTIRFLLPIIALLSVSPASAEVTWSQVDGTFELSGADLFRLRSELTPEQQESLKILRDTLYGTEAAFRDALTFNGVDDPALADKLVDIAEGPGVSLGYEQRGPGIVTLYLDDPEPVLETNAFTTQSWLPGIEEVTGDPTLTVSPDDGCLAVFDEGRWVLNFCRPDKPDGAKVAAIWSLAEHVVGLGQEFQVPGATAVERFGFVRHGRNVMEGFNGGANGNTLIPIGYFDSEDRPFAIVLDNRYPQEWDFATLPFEVRVKDGDLRIHVITGDNFAQIRRRFMELSGHPPVPPKAMFTGLWLSEYGFDNWAELDGKLATLEQGGFPVSGVVLDLQWFGDIDGREGSRMGSLTWDTEAFPDPKAKIAELAGRGLGVMVIEESYVSQRLPEFAALAAENALAHDAAGAPLLVNPGGNWWGTGGMIDWTSERARVFWHDYRRQALIDDGIIGHWTDLGEPEMINPDFVYGDDLTGGQVHNSYNLLWLEGIYDGYRRKTPEKRPFMMSRSGGMGMQAYGAAMWSGDTGSDFGSLAAQMPQQTHMMWSGIDYYGSDVGGFHRKALGNYPGDRTAVMDQLYTQWLAYAAMFEVPVRPHTENLCNCKETAPDRIGDRTSNYESLMLRALLSPYYYSLAHQAWLTGEPVFPSLDYWYPDDPNTKTIGHVKMVGPQIIAAAAAAHDAKAVDVYLPAGTWFDLHSLERIDSTGEFRRRDLYDHEGVYRLPLFVKDGAILPMQTELGTQLTVVGTAANRFDWYDDDGISTAYQRGEFEHVEVTVEREAVTLVRKRGSSFSPVSIHWVHAGGSVKKVLVNGTESSFETGDFGISLDLPALESRMKIQLVR